MATTSTSGTAAAAAEGHVRGGRVVLDPYSELPEGARVRVEAIAPLPPDHPDAPYDREVELAILREALEDVKANPGGGADARQFLKDLAARHGLPLAPGE